MVGWDNLNTRRNKYTSARLGENVGDERAVIEIVVPLM